MGSFCLPPKEEQQVAGAPAGLSEILELFGFSSAEELLAWMQASDEDSVNATCSAISVYIRNGTGGEQ